MKDATNQQLLLEKSDLDWTVVRTPIHNNVDVVAFRNVGLPTEARVDGHAECQVDIG